LRGGLLGGKGFEVCCLFVYGGRKEMERRWYMSMQVVASADNLHSVPGTSSLAGLTPSLARRPRPFISAMDMGSAVLCL